MRLPYTPNPPPTNDETEVAILKRIQERRGPGGLIALDRTLFHAPLIADGFNAFFKAIRTQNSLPADIRETAFCRVAALVKCWYEWDIHSPIAQEAGLSQEGLENMRKGIVGEVSGLDERQQAASTYADEITVDAKVSDATFNRLRQFLSDKQMVELTTSIAGFNTVARLCVALDVGEKNSKV